MFNLKYKITITINGEESKQAIEGAALLIRNIKTRALVRNFSDESGIAEFDLEKGHYNLEIKALGYFDLNREVKLLENKDIELNLCLESDKNTNLGSVSGILLDEFSKPIEKAELILYKIDPGNIEIPVCRTSTVNGGIYFFRSVPVGEYKVDYSLQNLS